jgi:hypothetical protein
MASFPNRCQHIKVNGTQCGSPALKSRRLCFFHKRWRETRIDFNKAGSLHFNEAFTLPVLEDANSVQVAIMQVLRLIIAKHLDAKTAGLLLYGLQTASLNLKRTRFEPYDHRNVVIEPRSVGDTLLGANVWDPREYEPDEAEEEDEQPEVAAADQTGNKEETTNAAETEEEKLNDDTIREQLAGKEHLLALPARVGRRESSSEPSLATLLATLVKLERMQKSP